MLFSSASLPREAEFQYPWLCFSKRNSKFWALGTNSCASHCLCPSPWPLSGCSIVFYNPLTCHLERFYSGEHKNVEGQSEPLLGLPENGSRQPQSSGPPFLKGVMLVTPSCKEPNAQAKRWVADTDPQAREANPALPLALSDFQEILMSRSSPITRDFIWKKQSHFMKCHMKTRFSWCIHSFVHGLS